MKELRTLRADSLRELCVKYNWYTGGSNLEYENLLDFVATKDNLTTEDILLIATDIIEHSTEQLTDVCLTNVCFEIAKKCVSYFVAE